MVSNLNKLTSPPQGVAVGIVEGKKYVREMAWNAENINTLF